MSSLPPVAAGKASGQRFQMLDLMRGIAAIAVLVYHDGGLLGTELLPHAYIAVDMFFLLSGFVIAHNYDRKIAGGMTLTDFMAQRVIRLYPCLLLTLLLGILVFCLRMTRDMGYFDGWRILGTAGLNALFLPSTLKPYGFEGFFPFDGAAWSLTFELIANIFYWIAFRFLTPLRIGLIIALSALGLTIAAYDVGTVDVGMRFTDFWWGVPRVMLTFFIGVALRRYFYAFMPKNLGGSAALIALAALLFAFSVGSLFAANQRPLIELLLVAVFFPALILLLGGANPGPKTSMICKLTGDASYPVYLLQTPLMGVFAFIPQLLFGMKAVHFVPWIGIAHVIGTILCALWVDRYFELPLRRILKDRWQKFRGSASPTSRPTALRP